MLSLTFLLLAIFEILAKMVKSPDSQPGLF
jgi:hypothetical protein